jgi:hypothetical protein
MNLRDLEEQNRYFEFNYPSELRFLFGIGAIFGLVSAVLSFRVTLIDDLELWIPLIFLSVGIFCIWFLALLSGTIVLDGNAVELRRFGRVT